MTPLLVSLAVQLEPLLGPALGWALGVAAAPGLFTWIGGSIVLLATLGATLATGRRQQQEEAAAAEAEGRLLLKNKSMRLPSVGAPRGDAGSSSYAPVAAVDKAEVGVHDYEQGLGLGGSGSGSGSVGKAGYTGRDRSVGLARNGDMDVIVSEQEHLLLGGSQLSHHVKPHVLDHQEIELPDIQEQR